MSFCLIVLMTIGYQDSRPNPEVVSDFIRQLKNGSSAEKIAVLDVMAPLAASLADPESLVSPVIDAMEDADPAVRVEAVKAAFHFRKKGKAAEEFVSALLRRLDDDLDQSVLMATLQSLSDFKEKARPAEKKIKEIYSGKKSPILRVNAAAALVNINPDDKGPVDFLLKSLEGKDIKFSMEVVRVLRYSSKERLLLGLAKCVLHPDEDLSSEAIEALVFPLWEGRVDPGKVTPYLKKSYFLHRGDESASWILLIYSGVRKIPEEAIPILLDGLSSEDDD